MEGVRTSANPPGLSIKPTRGERCPIRASRQTIWPKLAIVVDQKLALGHSNAKMLCVFKFLLKEFIKSLSGEITVLQIKLAVLHTLLDELVSSKKWVAFALIHIAVKKVAVAIVVQILDPKF